MSVERVEGLVRYLVTSLVDEPEAVKIEQVADGNDIVLEVTVAPDDIGKVVGKQGRIIKAIRTLARAASGSDERWCTSRSSARSGHGCRHVRPDGTGGSAAGTQRGGRRAPADGVPFLVSEGMRVWFVPPPRRVREATVVGRARSAARAPCSGSPR